MATETVQIVLDQTWQLISNATAGRFAARTVDGTNALFFLGASAPAADSMLGFPAPSISYENLDTKVWARGAGIGVKIGVTRTPDAGNPTIPMLGTLTLSGTTFTPGAPAGTEIGTFGGLSAGDAVSSIQPNDGRVVLNSDRTKLLVGMTASNAGAIRLRVRYRNSSAPNSPKEAEFTLTVSTSAPALALPLRSDFKAVHSVMRIDGYSGPAVQLQRANDSAIQDVGFNSAQMLDTAAADTFAAGSVTGFSRWYDQVGSFHLTNIVGQAYGVETGALARQPVCTAVTEYKGARPITHDGDSLAGNKNICFLRTNGGAPTVDRAAMTYYLVVGAHKARENMAIFELLDSTFGTSLTRALTNTSPIQFDNGTGIRRNAKNLRRGVQIVALSQSVGQVILRVGERETTIPLTGGNVTVSRLIEQLSLGRILNGAAYTGGIDFFFSGLCNVAHTSAQMVQVEAALMAAFGIKARASFTKAICYAGNSMISDFCATRNLNPPTIAGFGAATGDFTDWECFPFAVGGQRMAVEYENRAQEGYILDVYDATMPRFVYVTDMLTNDIRAQTFASQTEAEAWATDIIGTTTGARAAIDSSKPQDAKLIPHVQGLKALGSNVRVVVPTNTPAGTSTYSNANFKTYAWAKANEVIRSIAATYGFTVSDRAAIPQLQNPTTEFFAPDLLHTNDKGKPFVAACDKSAILQAAAS